MNINGKHFRTIWPEKDERKVCIIDQRRLPHNFVITDLYTVDDATNAISKMLVRGAGLIGATAGFGMYLATLNSKDNSIDNELALAAKKLNASRPTAKNLAWAVDRVLTATQASDSAKDKKEIAYATACEIANEDAAFCKRIGKHGLEIIKEISRNKKQGEPVNILTHCNAGWLAFVDFGSATSPIYAANDENINIHVWVDETRPWNQGAKLTSWELNQEGINNTLITDNTGGHIMQLGMVDLVIVGTDRTTHTGDVANKIGTYLKALAAKDNNIPFYVALPSSTFDWEINHGKDIPIEERDGSEITSVTGKATDGSIRTVQITADNTKAANYSFDITPARLVTGLITERGVVKPEKDAIHTLFKS